MFKQVAFTGIGILNSTDDLIRACLEGIANGFKDCLNIMEEISGKQPQKFLVAGGLAKSDFVCQLFADVLDMTVEICSCPEELIGARGSALVAGVGAGVYDSIEDAMRKTRSTVARRYEPVPQNVEMYKAVYERYGKLRNAVKTL